MTDKPKRPRDANQLAKFIVDVAAGDEPEVLSDKSDKSSKSNGKYATHNTPILGSFCLTSQISY